MSRPKQPRPKPKGGGLTRSLRQGQTQLYKAEQGRAQMMMKVTGGGSVAGLRLIRQSIRGGAAARTAGPQTASGRPQGKVSDVLRGTLQRLAKADAAYYRELGGMLGETKKGPKSVKSSKNPSRKRLHPGKS